MIHTKEAVATFKQIAQQMYISMIVRDYGEQAHKRLVELTDSIATIYRYLPYMMFKKIFIYRSVGGEKQTKVKRSKSKRVNSLESFASMSGESMIIECINETCFDVWVDVSLSISSIRRTSIVYSFNGSTGEETFFGKKESKVLPPILESNSYFAIQTYKDLDYALEEYGYKAARFSTCPILKEVWADPNRIFLIPKPEKYMRDSLISFLNYRLRGTEVRPEQVVDRSHPVDIKVTWSLANHLALIEIKWIGKTLDTKGKRSMKTSYTEKRALFGAKQLKDYLESNKLFVHNKITKGYLTVFDARRARCKTSTKTLSIDDGLKFVNKEIMYDPDYSSFRNDFARPVRFFMQPDNLI